MSTNEIDKDRIKQKAKEDLEKDIKQAKELKNSSEKAKNEKEIYDAERKKLISQKQTASATSKINSIYDLAMSNPGLAFASLCVLLGLILTLVYFPWGSLANIAKQNQPVAIFVLVVFIIFFLAVSYVFYNYSGLIKSIADYASIDNNYQTGVISAIVIAIMLFVLLFGIYYPWGTVIDNAKQSQVTSIMVIVFIGIFIAAFGFIMYKFPSVFSKLSSIQDFYTRMMVNLFIACLFIGTILFAVFFPWGTVFDIVVENPTVSIISILLIALLIGGVMLYRKYPSEMATGAKGLVVTDNFLLKRRNQAIVMLLIFVVGISVLYSYDPYGIISKYLGPTLVLSIIMGFFLVAVIMWYNYAYTNQDQMRVSETQETPIIDVVKKSLFFLVTFSITALFMYYIVGSIGNFDSKSNIGTIILNLLIIIVMLAIIYKFFSGGRDFGSIPIIGQLLNLPIFRLIIYSIFYIPCLLIDAVQMIISAFTGTGKFAGKSAEIGTKYILWLILGILLFVLYFVVPIIENKLIVQNGMVVLNEPIYLDTYKALTDYITLHDGDDKYEYQYGLSFWFYIDARPPSTASSYQKYTSILSYGIKPSILYKADTNTLIIVIEQKGLITSENNKIDKTEVDENGNRIIYKQENILLQKWNNMIINYSGGTLDIFMNGKLVKSAINIVPYMSYDSLTVGEDDGIQGAICNVTYYKTPMSMSQIYYLNNLLKSKTPPTIPNQ